MPDYSVTDNQPIIKGSIFYVVRNDEKELHPQGRPMIVVSSILVNDTDICVNMISMVETEFADLPTHVNVKFSGKDCIAVCERIHRIPKKCLIKQAGKVSDTELGEINKRLNLVLELTGDLKPTSDFVKNYEKEYKKSVRKEEERINNQIADVINRESQKIRDEYQRKLDESNRNIENLQELNDLAKNELASMEEQCNQVQEENDKLREKISKENNFEEEKDAMIAALKNEIDHLRKSTAGNIANNPDLVSLREELDAALMEKDMYKQKYFELKRKSN